MKTGLIVFLFLPFMAFSQLSPDQERQIDSLKQVINTSDSDSIIITSLLAWDHMIYLFDSELDYKLNQKIDSICTKKLSEGPDEKYFFQKARANALAIQGNYFEGNGDYARAIEYYLSSLKINQEIGNLKGYSNRLINLGNAYNYQGDFEKSMDYYLQSLKILEELEDEKGSGMVLNNIGSNYYRKGDFANAMDYYKQGLLIHEKYEDKIGIAGSLVNIGNIYLDQDDNANAMLYFKKSLKVWEEAGESKGLANCLNNIGNIYFLKGQYNQSINYASKSLKLAREFGSLKLTMNASELLWKNYEKQGLFKNAFTMYSLYIQSRDSLQSVENEKKMIKQQYQFEYEKRAAADSIKAEEAAKVSAALLAATEAENNQRKQEIINAKQRMYFLYGGLALALLFGVFIFNRFQVTKKQKGFIEAQKIQVDSAYKLLGVKNKEILDSINYAKRIQTAILPPIKEVKASLKESFIYYQPKDIVAGDFYWMEKQDAKILFAAADCTGHGVPGAMVSVVCNNGLNRSVKEFHLTEPGEILDKTREIIIKEFEKSDEDVQDGMDIALCSLEGKTLRYSGAHNPLWIIRENELIALKADKQPVGLYFNAISFRTHTIELQSGDMLYLFTDGFVDQFGGEHGKKFKINAFKDLLLSINTKAMEEQHEILISSFNHWRGDLEQVDDVCIIGVRV